MEDHNIGFILGFIAGEGCFSFMLNEEPTTSSGINGGPFFRLNVKHDEDRLINNIVNLTGHGRVRYGGGASRETDVVYIDIVGWESCKEFADDIERAAPEDSLFRESKKWQSFQRWHDIVKRGGWSIKTEEELRSVLEDIKQVNADGNNGQTVEQWMERSKF